MSAAAGVLFPTCLTMWLRTRLGGFRSQHFRGLHAFRVEGRCSGSDILMQRSGASVRKAHEAAEGAFVLGLLLPSRV